MPGRKRDKINTPVNSPDDALQHDKTDLHENEDQTQGQPHGLSEVDEKLSNRSGRSAVRGGENNFQGEPPSGYGTEAPGKQGGGKR